MSGRYLLRTVSGIASVSIALPHGVSILPLHMHGDDRGVFTEVYRLSWNSEFPTVQWNYVRSRQGVLRGVHMHKFHHDYLILVEGRAVFGLKDLRPRSPTEGMTAMVEASGDCLQAITIPPGVAHGFYFHTDAVHLYGVSRYWDLEDELGCPFDDPQLGLVWPNPNPHRSERDLTASPLSALLRHAPVWQG